jgi:phosphoribosylanthranilate isomerase
VVETLFHYRGVGSLIFTAAKARPIVLAGGLDSANVGCGIASLRPYAVDVSSGIESRPGIKDAGKMRAFVAAVRRADQKLQTSDNSQ